MSKELKLRSAVKWFAATRSFEVEERAKKDRRLDDQKTVTSNCNCYCKVCALPKLPWSSNSVSLH